MPFIDQKEKRASILDEPYAAGILLMLRDREIKGESLLTLSGVKHTVSANYNSVKKILIWMEDMGIIEINQSEQEEHPRPGRPGHNVELTEKGKNIADSLNEVVEYMGQIPLYRKGIKEASSSAKASVSKTSKPTAKTAKVTKPATKAVKPATKAAPKNVKASAKATPKTRKTVASKTTAKKVTEKKKPASSKRVAKRAKK